MNPKMFLGLLPLIAALGGISLDHAQKQAVEDRQNELNRRAEITRSEALVHEAEVKTAQAKQKLAELEVKKASIQVEQKTIPAKANSLKLTQNGKLWAELQELQPFSGIFLTAAHNLEGLTTQELAKLFAAKNLDLKNYTILSFHQNGQTNPFLGEGTNKTLDALLLVPKSKIDQIRHYVATASSSNCNCSADVYRLKDIPELGETVSDGTEYYLYHSGQVGDDQTTGHSEGQVQAVGEKAQTFYLPPSQKNLLTRGSSGSLVNCKDSKNWKVCGLVECQYDAKPSDKSLDLAAVPGGIRVISSSALKQADVEEVIDLEAFLKQRPHDPNCHPINARGGGG